MTHLAHIALIVCDYDEAFAFYVGKLGFTLVEDGHQREQDKRWVTIQPPGVALNATTILLACHSGSHRAHYIGDQRDGLRYAGLQSPIDPKEQCLWPTRPPSARSGTGASRVRV